MSLAWAVAGGFIYFLLRRDAGRKAAIVIGLCILSHWFLDLIVHKPDLEIWIGGPKIGLGLWDHKYLTLALEIGLLSICSWIYLRATAPIGAVGRFAPGIFLLLMIGLQIYVFWGAPPESPHAMAISALVAYALLVAGAAVLDATRRNL